MPAQQVLMACTLAAGVWLATTLLGGWLGDRIGRVRTFQIGYVLLALWAVPMWASSTPPTSGNSRPRW